MGSLEYQLQQLSKRERENAKYVHPMRNFLLVSMPFFALAVSYPIRRVWFKLPLCETSAIISGMGIVVGAIDAHMLYDVTTNNRLATARYTAADACLAAIRTATRADKERYQSTVRAALKKLPAGDAAVEPWRSCSTYEPPV